ncbi:MAG: M23 family metallopeptidase [Spirochaetota bacterium]
MLLNPFTESNLQNLQTGILKISADIFCPILQILKTKWVMLAKNAREQITIIIVPHNEKKILNYNLHIYSIITIVIVFISGLIFTSVSIINFSYTSKNVSKLTLYDANSKLQIKEYKEEITKLYDKFQELKSGISLLYSTITEENSNSLWAKGGESALNADESSSPSIEELNMKELDQELKASFEILGEIKNYLKNKNIIESAPSIRPVIGYILSEAEINTHKIIYDKANVKGVAIAAFPGTKIRATAPGKVEAVVWDKLLGIKITIRHKYGFSSIFSHCRNVIVKPNQNVSKGETIGYTGSTGSAAKAICFYQIRIGNEFVNPLPYIK